MRDGFCLRKDRVLKDGNVSYRCIVRTCCGRVRIHEPDIIVLSTEHNHEPRNNSGEQQTIPDASSNGKRRRMQKKPRSSTEEVEFSTKDN